MCCWVRAFPYCWPTPVSHTHTLTLNLSLSLSLSPHHYRKSANCTHVSAVLHALTGLNPTSFNLNPRLPPAIDDDDDEMPVTLPCQWKAPKKRKESTMPLSEATFEKHEYGKPVKRKIKHVEHFDPRPSQFRGSTMSRLN